MHRNSDEARRSDAAESGSVSNAFVHSYSRWQTLRSGWNPSLVKLAQTPGFLDLFHFRELCHMLTVNHEALLPQSWGVGWEASGRTGVDLKENTVGGENVRKYGGGLGHSSWKKTCIPWRSSTRGHQRWTLFTQTLFSDELHILQLISLTWHLPSMNHPRDLQQPTHAHTTHTPPCPLCCLCLVDPPACLLLLHKH